MLKSRNAFWNEKAFSSLYESSERQHTTIFSFTAPHKMKNMNMYEYNCGLTMEQRCNTEDRYWQRQQTNAGSFCKSDPCWHHWLWLGVKLQIDMSSSRDVMFALVTNRNIMPPPSPLWKCRSDTGLIDLELDTIPLCHTPVPWSAVIVDNCTTHAHTFQNNSAGWYWLYAGLVKDTPPLLTDILSHPS